MVSGSSVVEFGTRNLALHSALSHRTVSRVLRILRDEPDPLIDLVSVRKLARADRYALRIPDRYADSVRWRRRRAGRVEAAHPAFLVLGGTAALAYEALGPDPARGAEVARASRLSGSAVSAELRVLAEHGLAERGPGGWRRGPVALAGVAAATGAADLKRGREARYRQDRDSWRARLRQYQGAKRLPVIPRDGWWPLDDDDEYDELSRWPVLSDDFVRGPPALERRHAAETARASQDFFIASFAIGVGGTGWTLQGEVFPTAVRGQAAAIAAAVDWLANFALIEIFPVWQNAISLAGVLVCFAGLCLAAIGFVYRWLPETKRLSVEEAVSVFERQADAKQAAA